MGLFPNWLMRLAKQPNTPVLTDRHDPNAVRHSADGDGETQARSTTGDVGGGDRVADGRESPASRVWQFHSAQI